MLGVECLQCVGLDVDDLYFAAAGVVVTLRRSKTDQEAQGRRIGVPYGSRHETCPVRTLKCWLERANIATGPVFREITRGDRPSAAYIDKKGRQRGDRLSDKTVALVVKRAAKMAGLDPAKYAGHSLRAGLATSAAAAGVVMKREVQLDHHQAAPMARILRTPQQAAVGDAARGWDANLFNESQSGHSLPTLGAPSTVENDDGARRLGRAGQRALALGSHGILFASTVLGSGAPTRLIWIARFWPG